MAMKKNIKILFLFLIVTILFSACKKENRCDCFKRTGSVIIETREISGFDKIYVEDNLNVFLTQDSIFSVKVEAGENIAPLIKTEVRNGTLYIKNDNRCNWTRSYDKPFNVYITMPVITYVTSDGTGNIKGLNTIKRDTIDVQIKNSGNIELSLTSLKINSHMHGSGDVTLSGTTYEHACDIGGTGYLYCTNLKTRYTFVHTFTTGICYVNCSGYLICIIDRIGDVYCYGHPATVAKTLNSSGKLYLQ